MKFNGQEHPGGEFAKRIYAVVEQIPEGRVMTYGQIAALCGSAKAARIVGGIAHYGPPSLPWHRVVNKNGRLAAGYHGGRLAQKQHLEAEGVEVFGKNDDYYIRTADLIWSPYAA